ncbi:hypothetical protein CY34DRAFT_394315 [Suillus luteus UH-Slu-Lm8-n1]|uniref:Uncharacterized protein n=1 Tax=Suillus luteus UH-Slu-Lm8-n1 TaxID=930992 RepID=A0A0C9ZLP2_9AGAM|nr:hypothetical protein CY34DRAFT_394315 [Suillus luteus UH-Slu-Lm8-n1]
MSHSTHIFSCSNFKELDIFEEEEQAQIQTCGSMMNTNPSIPSLPLCPCTPQPSLTFSIFHEKPQYAESLPMAILYRYESRNMTH